MIGEDSSDEGSAERRRSALSLVELVIAVCVTGLLASVAVYSVANTTRLAREQTALARAELIDASRKSYALSRPDSDARWRATEVAQRTTLLANAGMLSVPAGFLSVAGGYELVLEGELTDRTTVRCNGTVLQR